MQTLSPMWKVLLRPKQILLMKIETCILNAFLVAICACDSKAPAGSGTGTEKSTKGVTGPSAEPYRTLGEEEPILIKFPPSPANALGRLSYGRIHPDLPGEGTHVLGESQTKLCFESITSTVLPAEAEFVSGKMERHYAFTKERNPIRNSYGKGELVFRIPRAVAGGLMAEIVAQLKRLEDEREVNSSWVQWDGKKEVNSNAMKTPPPLDGNTSLRFAVSFSDHVRALYFYSYDSLAEVFQIEYDFDNTRD
jgi:hypothetical protein